MIPVFPPPNYDIYPMPGWSIGYRRFAKMRYGITRGVVVREIKSGKAWAYSYANGIYWETSAYEMPSGWVPGSEWNVAAWPCLEVMGKVSRYFDTGSSWEWEEEPEEDETDG